MSERACPIFLVNVTQEREAEFYVAAEDAKEAERVAEQVARNEMAGWPSSNFYNAIAHPADGISDRHIHELGGVYVEKMGDWVQQLDDVPPLPPIPDPNQLVMELHEKPVPHLETIKMPGGTL